MIGDSQRLQGCGGCGVRRAISSTPSKVTRLQGLQGLRGSLSDKFQRYSPSFDIIIIIIILKVDIRGCEVARVSWFRRAISTHITCHIYTPPLCTVYNICSEHFDSGVLWVFRHGMLETMLGMRPGLHTTSHPPCFHLLQ